MSEAVQLTLPIEALPPDAPPDYVEKMIARAEGNAPPVKATEVKAEETPLIAGKFKTQDDLVKAYSELEKKLGSAPAKPATEAPQVVAPAPNGAKAAADAAATAAEAAAVAAAIKAAAAGATDADKAAAWAASEAAKVAKADAEKVPVAAPDEAQKIVEGAGLNWQAMSNAYAETGELPEADYAALEKAGIPKGYVDQYIAGQQAIADRQRSEIFSVVGGQEKYVEMVGWAKGALSADEQSTYNAMVNGTDRNAAKLAVSGLQAKYSASGATDPTLIGGSASGATTGFKSSTEWKTAMKDPKYQTDADYRQEVQNKLKVSSFKQ